MTTTGIQAVLALVCTLCLAPLAKAAPEKRAAAETSKQRTITDQGITDAVETEIARDPAVPAYEIDVMTNEGIVTLSGTVNNLLAKGRAERLAEAVRGVRSIVNRLEVVTAPRNDVEIRKEVIEALASDPAADAYEISVTAEDGRLRLTGQVDSWYERHLAERIARSVRGVKEVENRVTVQTSERPDDEIRADLLSRLQWDRYLDHSLIEIDVKDGKVKLSGAVGSAAEKRRAKAKAWTVGVKDIDVRGLEVAYWARDDRLREGKYVQRSDEEISRAIQDALFYDPRIRSTDVGISVDSGVATLRGKVASLQACRAAADTARNTVGVLRVKNFLKVRSEKQVADSEIAERLQQALERDPVVDRFEIKTVVSAGVVYLHGLVDSYFERAQAEQVAAAIAGVRDVRNNLVVGHAWPILTYSPYVDSWYPYDFDWHVYNNGASMQVKRSDWAIEEDIEDQLWWSPFVDANEVDVDVNQGVATLTGTVDTWAEHSAARENALEGGALRVIDKLEIRNGPAA